MEAFQPFTWITVPRKGCTPRYPLEDLYLAIYVVCVAGAAVQGLLPNSQVLGLLFFFLSCIIKAFRSPLISIQTVGPVDGSGSTGAPHWGDGVICLSASILPPSLITADPDSHKLSLTFTWAVAHKAHINKCKSFKFKCKLHLADGDGLLLLLLLWFGFFGGGLFVFAGVIMYNTMETPMLSVSKYSMRTKIYLRRSYHIHSYAKEKKGGLGSWVSRSHVVLQARGLSSDPQNPCTHICKPRDLQCEGR